MSRQAKLTATLGKGLEVLEALADVEETGLTELARRLEASPPTLFRILSTLVAHGYAQKQGGRYRLSLKPWELGAKAVRRLKLRELARRHLASLAESSGEAAHLAVMQGTGVVIIDKVDVPQPVQVDTHVGQRAPLHCSATGKAMLAFAPSGILEALLGGDLERYTPRTIIERSRLERELASVRRRGHALNRGEWRDDVSAIALPLRDHAERVVGAVSLTMPTMRFTEAAIRTRFLPPLNVAARAISAELGRTNE
jgi:IclR family transcriptional regulator, KDG regulon repressor